MDILPEPLYKWTNLEGNDMLGLIYDDPERWGLAQVQNIHKGKRSHVEILLFKF